MKHTEFRFLRRFVLISAALAFISSLFGAAATHQAVVTRNKESPFYEYGEAVTFTITVTLIADGSPAVNQRMQCRVMDDNLEPALWLDTHYWTDSNGQIVVNVTKTNEAITRNTPGFIHFRTDAKDISPGASARSVAAYSPLKIEASMPPPDDFDAYWDEQKRLLAETPANVTLTPKPTGVPGIDTYDVQAKIPLINFPMYDTAIPADIQGRIGVNLKENFSAYLSIPQGTQPKSAPAIILLQGAGLFASRLETLNWAQRGFIAIDFNVHGFPNDISADDLTALRATDLKNYYLHDINSKDTIFFRLMYMRLLRAIDIITNRPEWDGKILIACGRSQGGGQAIVAGGLDPRVTFIAAQIPAMCDHTGSPVNRINGWPKLLSAGTNKVGSYTSQQMQNVRYFDAMNFATRSTAGAFLTCGFIDVSCAPTGVYATYNNLRGKKSILNLPHLGHVTSTEGDEGVVNSVMAHVAEMKMPVPTEQEELLAYALNPDYSPSASRSSSSDNGGLSYLPQTSVTANNTLAISFAPYRRQVSYEVQCSTDLQNWDTIQAISGNGSLEPITVEATEPLDETTKRFLRVKIVPQQ